MLPIIGGQNVIPVARHHGSYQLPDLGFVVHHQNGLGAVGFLLGLFHALRILVSSAGVGNGARGLGVAFITKLTNDNKETPQPTTKDCQLGRVGRWAMPSRSAEAASTWSALQSGHAEMRADANRCMSTEVSTKIIS